MPIESRNFRVARRWMGSGALALLAMVVVWGIPRGAAKEGEGAAAYRVIVHADNRVAAASRDFVANAFLKRATRWRQGSVIRPVDLSSDSRVREQFSRHVLRRSVEAVRSYWQQKIFSGRGLPPPELASEAAVVEYVAKHRGGIGYVGRDTELHGVKVLVVR